MTLSWGGDRAAYERGLRPLTYPLDFLARVLTWLLVGDAVLNVLAVPALLSHLHTLQTAARLDASPDAGEHSPSGDQLALVTLFQIGVLIACAVAFGMWFYRARRNVEAYGGTHQHYGPGWAIGAWFVPVLNIAIPARIVLDVLRDSIARRRLLDYVILAVWWIAWVARWGAYLSAGHFARIHGGIALNLATACAEIVAALAMVYLVRRISAGQAVRERELDAGTA